MARTAEGWRLLWRNGIAHVRFTHQGDRITLTTGERDPARAAEVAARIYADVIAGRRRVVDSIASSRTPLEVLAAEWLAAVEGVLAQSTRDDAIGTLRRHLIPHFGTLGGVNEASLGTYWRTRVKHALRSSVEVELQILRGMLVWAREQGYLAELPPWPRIPARVLGVRAKGRQPGRLLSVEQVARLLAAMPEVEYRESYVIRDRFIVMYESSLRGRTLDLITLADVRARACALVIRDEADKVRFGREVPLSARAVAALERAVAFVRARVEATPQTLVFGRHNYARHFINASRAAELPFTASPYDLRHSRITHLQDAGASITGTAYLAGHRRVTTTAGVYTHPSAGAARAAIELSGSILDQAEEDMRKTAENCDTQALVPEVDTAQNTDHSCKELGQKSPECDDEPSDSGSLIHNPELVAQALSFATAWDTVGVSP